MAGISALEKYDLYVWYIIENSTEDGNDENKGMWNRRVVNKLKWFDNVERKFK